jgi:hypothetical protein
MSGKSGKEQRKSHEVHLFEEMSKLYFCLQGEIDAFQYSRAP